MKSNSAWMQIRPAVVSTLVLASVCCGAYPAAVWGLAHVLFPAKAGGSLIMDAEGRCRGSALLGQPFSGARYFHPRPSAAGAGYDAANSGGSNLGPTSQKLRDAIRDRVTAYRAENGLNEQEPIPADAVTASGSGLDPHISVRNATIQATRVAQARGLPEADVLSLIQAAVDGPDFGILGEAGVNVLKLNLALDHRTAP